MDFGMMPEFPEASDQIVEDLLAWRRFADDEALAGQIRPRKLRTIRKPVIRRKNGEHLFRPELLDFTTVS